MSVDSLQAAILKEVQEQVREIEQASAQEMERMESASKEKLTHLEEQIVSAAEADGMREARRIKQEAHLEAKADILEAKEEELVLTQQAVTEAILSWDKEEIRQLLKAMLDQLSDADGEIMAGAEHKEAVSALAKEKGLKMIDETVAGEGGFVVRYPYGEIDMRLSRMVQHVFTRHRAVIAQNLFDGSGG